MYCFFNQRQYLRHTFLVSCFNILETSYLNRAQMRKVRGLPNYLPSSNPDTYYLDVIAPRQVLLEVK